MHELITYNKITTSTVCTKKFASFQIMQILTPVSNVITQQATSKLDRKQVLNTNCFILLGQLSTNKKRFNLSKDLTAKNRTLNIDSGKR